MIYAGIDPGLDGAFAVIDNESEERVQFFDVPVIKITKGKKNKRLYDVHAMADILREYLDRPALVMIERVHAMPKQGVVSTFSFGEGFGIWQGLLAFSKLPFDFVTPQAWKKSMGLLGQDKDAARLKAMRLFPSVADQLRLKKHVGRADALLIAEFGRQRDGGG